MTDGDMLLKKISKERRSGIRHFNIFESTVDDFFSLEKPTNKLLHIFNSEVVGGHPRIGKETKLTFSGDKKWLDVQQARAGF